MFIFSYMVSWDTYSLYFGFTRLHMVNSFTCRYQFLSNMIFNHLFSRPLYAYTLSFVQSPSLGYVFLSVSFSFFSFSTVICNSGVNIPVDKYLHTSWFFFFFRVNSQNWNSGEFNYSCFYLLFKTNFDVSDSSLSCLVGQLSIRTIAHCLIHFKQ